MQNRSLYMWSQTFGPCGTFVYVSSWLTAVLVLLVILIFAVIILQNITSFTQSPAAGMTQAETESRSERERQKASLTAARGHTDSPCVTGMLILLIQPAFFYGCLGSWSDHWTWHRRWWLGHWHKMCVCWCVTIPSPQQHPLTINDIICLRVSCHGYSLVAQRRSARGRRGWPLPSVLLPFTSKVTHQPLPSLWSYVLLYIVITQKKWMRNCQSSSVYTV